MPLTLPHRGLLRRALITLLAPVSATTVADQHPLTAPLVSRNLSPFETGLGMPAMAAANALNKGRWNLTWDLHWASHAVREVGNEGDLELDGETRRQDLRLVAGITDRLTLMVDVPWIHHSAGSLDSLIDGWHDFWGLPEGDRADQPQDKLRFAVSGTEEFALEQGASGLGDVELGLAWEFWGDERQDLAAFTQITLDTGDNKDLTGSGDTAVAAGLRYSRQRCVFSELSCHVQAGLIDPGSLEFTGRQRSLLMFGGLSLVWQPATKLALIAQLESREGAYEVGPLSTHDMALWGSLGLRWQPGTDWVVEAQFSEDLKVESAPDITFRLALGRHW